MHSVRYAHSDGFTEICCALDKNHQFVTSGEDGEVRIWQSFDDVDSRSIQIGEKCTALAYGDNRIYVADDQNEVKRYDFESGELLGVVTSFTLPVTCMALNKSCNQLVCGSADFEVQLVDLQTLKTTKFTGHQAPILSLCFDPFQKYFISSSCDATARVWSVANSSQIKLFDNLHPKSNDFMDSDSWCRIAWHKDGGLLAIPSKKDVEFYERESWAQKFKINLKNDNNPGEEFFASILSFSPDGKFILALTNTQMVFVHSIINKSLVYKYAYSKKNRISSLVWHATTSCEEIIFCDTNGQMGQIKPTLKDSTTTTTTTSETSKQTSLKPASKPEVKETKETKEKKTKKPVVEDEDLEMDELMELLGDNDDEASNQESVKSSEIGGKKKSDKSKNSPKKRKRLSDDELDESSRDSEAKSSKNEDDDIEDLNDDDDDLESIEKLKERAYKLAKKEVLLEDALQAKETASASETSVKQVIVEQVQQKPFQPSSTPLNLPERYMVWNTVGVITQFSKDEDDSIDIEFHNASHHHTIHMKNQLGYTMADMSREVVVLASPGRIDADSQADEVNEVLAQSVTSVSKLTCIMLNSLDSAGSKEWQIDMPKKENIRCVCASRLLIACATSRKFLRVFHLSGVQREIICLNGQPICVAAYDQKIFVCYNFNNAIGYSIYHVKNENCKILAEHGMLPISGPDSQLNWIGFSEEGNPYCYDSNGYLYLRTSSSPHGVWTPISYVRHALNHKTDNYWVVGIAERNQLVKAILCRGSKHPNVLPRPNMTTLTMHVPLCDPEAEKTKLEQDYWRNMYLNSNLKTYDCQSQNIEGMDEDEIEETSESFESAARESLMKLFMLACRTGKEQRAYDVARIMDVDTIQLAIKFATKSRALTLAHNLNDLAEKKLRQQSQEQAVDSQIEDIHYHHNSNMMRSTRASGMDDTNDIIVESVTTQNTSTLSKSITQDKHNRTDTDGGNSQLMNESVRTPTIPLTNTRINPFANKSSTKTPTILDTAGEENNTPKSVFNTIEDKLLKRNTQSAKEKDAWKPTPARKLVKSKVSSGTPTIGTFFNN